MTLSNDHIIAWVTQPERPKAAKDEVKGPEGPPKLLVLYKMLTFFYQFRFGDKYQLSNLKISIIFHWFCERLNDCWQNFAFVGHPPFWEPLIQEVVSHFRPYPDILIGTP